MTRLSINLPDEITKKLAARATESGHPNLEEYVEAVLRVEAEVHDTDAPSQVAFLDEAELLRNLKAGEESGEARPISDEAWNEKRRRLIERHSKQGRE